MHNENGHYLHDVPRYGRTREADQLELLPQPTRFTLEENDEQYNRYHADEEYDRRKARITKLLGPHEQECNPADEECPALPLRRRSPSKAGWFRRKPVAHNSGPVVPALAQYARRTGTSSRFKHAAMKSRTRPRRITHQKSDFIQIDTVRLRLGRPIFDVLRLKSGLRYLIKDLAPMPIMNRR